MFLGYNAHEPWGYMGINRERFYEGNPSFYTDRDNPVWKIWHRPYKAFNSVGYLEPMTDGNFVFMNVVYFGSDTIKDFQAKSGSAEVAAQCMDFTAEVIQDIFRPKCVVCFSINDCFRPLERRFGFAEVETITPLMVNGHPARHKVVKGLWNNLPVYGIPHPSGRVNHEDWDAMALYLKNEMTAL